MDLPPETRNRIYELSLISADTIRIVNAARYKVFGEELCQPPLTKVSQVIRNETLPIFYGSNKFEFDYWMDRRE